MSFCLWINHPPSLCPNVFLCSVMAFGWTEFWGPRMSVSRKKKGSSFRGRIQAWKFMVTIPQGFLREIFSQLMLPCQEHHLRIGGVYSSAPGQASSPVRAPLPLWQEDNETHLRESCECMKRFSSGSSHMLEAGHPFLYHALSVWAFHL